MVKGISFDVWGTIFGDSFFDEIDKHYSEETGMPKEEADQKTNLAYRELRKRRKLGAIPREENPVDYSLRLLEAYGFNIQKFKKAMAKALITVDVEKLLIPGVRDVVRQLSSQFTLVVLGNVVYWPGAYTRVLMEKAGISAFLSSQLYSDEIGTAKPSRDAFELALREMGLQDPAQAVHVGDNLYEDFGGAVGADFHAVLVNRKASGELYVDGNFVITDIRELPRVIRAIDSGNSPQPPAA
ncbi:MAG: HAD family hydrolase [Candidatus Marsarchaeota archaeon]